MKNKSLVLFWPIKKVSNFENTCFFSLLVTIKSLDLSDTLTNKNSFMHPAAEFVWWRIRIWDFQKNFLLWVKTKQYHKIFSCTSYNNHAAKNWHKKYSKSIIKYQFAKDILNKYKITHQIARRPNFVSGYYNAITKNTKYFSRITNWHEI